MMIGNEDGTFTAGPLDVLCILQHEKTGRFHPAFVEERPLPGPVPSPKDMTFARMKSKMHHTTGFDTLEAAVTDLREDLAKKLSCRSVLEKPLLWNGVPFACIWPVKDGSLDLEHAPQHVGG